MDVPSTHCWPLALLAVVGCSRGDRVDPPHPLPDAGSAFAVTIHDSAKLRSVPVPNGDGGVDRVACAACHSLKPPKPLPRAMADLRAFHEGLSFKHGDLSCAHCHVEGARSHDTLHLASAEILPMRDAMRLCAQCHGPQFRDYTRGSHGGMQGHFALELGPRVRNHCVDCHDPHAPRFPGFFPVLPPRDRGTVTSFAGGHHG